MSDTYWGDLRKRAEQKLQEEHPDLHRYTTVEFETLVHELRVHQIELELQNAELLRTQSELENAYRQYASLFDFAPVGYFILDSAKKIIKCNRTGSKMFGKSRKILVNNFFFDLIADADQDIFYLQFNRLIDTALPQTFEIQMKRADGTLFFALLDCVVVLYKNNTSYRITLSDITEQKKAEIQAQNVRIMGDFFANAAHDLKTPITILMTSLYLLDNEVHTERQNQIIQKLKRQVARLSALTENMFHMSALDVQDSYNFHPTDIIELVEQIVEEFLPIVELKQQMLKRVYEEESLVVEIDPFFMQRAIGNLISNAVTYSPDESTISVRISSNVEHVVIEIQDEGPGINKKDLPRIFDRFYRSDESRNSKTGGGGLGLSIVRKIVEGHTGYIEVDSEVGKGSNFRIILPCHQQIT